jgi:hypothetical protein
MSTQRLARGRNGCPTGVTENGAETGVRRGGVCRVGQESGAGDVQVSSVGTCQVQAEKLDNPLSGGACVR